MNGSSSVLAHRLRELRETGFLGVSITQRQLARALGGSKPVSAPLISSWERAVRPTSPPRERLAAYATFFATPRSVERTPYRLLPADELTDQERSRRDELERELLELKSAQRGERAGQVASAEPVGGLWHFGDEHTITIVYSVVPEKQRTSLPRPEDPELCYAELYAVADLDALFELHGHIRAANPTSRVVLRRPPTVTADDLTTHLVVVGGVDLNETMQAILDRPELPVRQVGGRTSPADGYFEVKGDAQAERFGAELVDGSLVADVGHFYRAPNPFNRKRTVTLCSAMYSRGTLGVVSALTDERFRERNTEYVRQRFPDGAFSILTKVFVVAGVVITPDWTKDPTRLHEWPANSAPQ